MIALVSFLSGAVFAVGLALSGMTQPSKIVGFLDVTGHWDPSLMFVMVGAVGVYAIAYRLSRRRGAPLLTARYSPLRYRPNEIDIRLVVGAALFGVGWGLSGYCPGPAILSLSAGTSAALTFVPAMLAGMILYQVLNRAWGWEARPDTAPPALPAVPPPPQG